MSRAGAALAAMLAASVAACDLGPDYKAPQTAIPAAWDNTLAGAPASWPSPDWWTGFGSPQLNALISQARAGNTDLAAATYRLRAAQAEAEIAGAPLYPSVEFAPVTGPERELNLTGQERHHVLYQAFAKVSYEIDFWGKNRAALQSAEATANSTRFARDVVWITTSTGVVNLYLQQLALQDRMRVAQDNLGRAQHILDGVVMQERQGIVPHLAVVQQQAVVAGVATVLPPLQQQLVAAQVALAILVGRLPEELHLPPGSLRDIRQPQLAAGVPAELLARRPDVHQAEATLVAANADIRVARASFFPSFGLNLSAGPTSLTLARGTVPILGAYSLLASVTQPIFEGGALQGKLDQTKARYQELLLGSYRSAVLSAFGDVETALASVKAAQQEQEAQQRSATLAQQSSGLASRSLQGGVGTILNLLTAETADYSAQDALVQAQLGSLQAVVGLIKALGGGWTT